MHKLIIASLTLIVLVGGMLLVIPARAQVGDPYHGFILIELTGSLAEPMTEDRYHRVRQAFAMFAPERGEWPPYLLQYRLRLDRKAVIVEARFNALPSKTEVVREIAQRLGLTTTVVNNNLAFTVLGGVDATWQQSRDAAAAYLQANVAAWEASE